MRTPWQIQKSVVFALFIRELKTRFGSYKGGYIWLLVEPLAHVIILSTIFSYLRHPTLSVIDVPVYIVTGIVPFLMFKNITLRVMDSVDANRGLFAYRQIKPMDTYIARTLLDGFLSIAVFGILLAAMAWLGRDIPFRNPLVIGCVFALLILMGLGLGMIFSIITHYLPESKTLLRLIFLPLFLLSGILFPLAAIPQQYLPFIIWNPLLHAIEILRSAFFMQYHVVEDVSLLFFILAALVVTFLGFSWYWTKRYKLLAR